jgi:hypothetical protein
MMGMHSAMTDDRQPELPASIRLARIGLAALAAVLSVNLWTGAPLLAIWVGSRVQGGTGLSMGAVGAVLGTLAVTVALLVFLLVRVEAAYKVLSGHPTPPRRATPWLRSLRDERPELAVRRSLTGFDKAIIATVVVAIAAFELWFFVLAGSPIG